MVIYCYGMNIQSKIKEDGNEDEKNSLFRSWDNYLFDVSLFGHRPGEGRYQDDDRTDGRIMGSTGWRHCGVDPEEYSGNNGFRFTGWGHGQCGRRSGGQGRYRFWKFFLQCRWGDGERTL